MSAVVVTAVFTPANGKRDQLIEALKEAIPAVHEEEGCELYAIHNSPDGTIVMLEKWTTRALLDAHAAGEPVTRLNSLIDGLTAQPVAVTVMDPIAAGTAQQGSL